MNDGQGAPSGTRARRARTGLGLIGVVAVVTTLGACRPQPNPGTTTTRPTTAPTTRPTTRPTSGPTATTGPTTPPPPASNGADGWAGTNGGTSGGAGGASVTVTSGSALTEALKQPGPQTIRVQGMVSMTGMTKVLSNTTIVGVGASSGITGGGLQLRSVKNVIIRNLVFTKADDDSINVEEGSTNIWIDHNDLSDGYDGLVDIKRGSDFVTVSWNHVHDHHKTMLLGHSDDNGSQDRGHLRVSYHHNFFDGTQTRHPRVRFANPVHVYNNYYRGNEYGVASTEGAGVLVEGNVFENVKSPTLVGYEDSGPGALVQRDNLFSGSGTPQASGSVASIPYRYTLEAASGIKVRVSAGAGTGKVS
jgi:pectate lyase